MKTRCAVSIFILGFVLANVAAAGGFVSGNIYDALETEMLKVKPIVKPYTVRPSLSNITNIKSFKSFLGKPERAMIARNGFVVSPTDYIQMFQVYENNEYQRPLKLPAFITSDAMLHTYHIFYDYALRMIEKDHLYGAAVKLTNLMLNASTQQVAEAKDEAVKDAALRNVAYFAVARKLLGGDPPPKEVGEMANADLAKIGLHNSREVSAILKWTIDFSQFVPRGHYTRSELLRNYFRAMMWYGLSSLALPVNPGDPGRQTTVQSLLITRYLDSSDGAIASKLWDKIYEPTVFYVGSADDYTISDYAPIMHKVFGKTPEIDRLGDTEKLDTFIAEAKKLLGPGIENFVAVSRSDSRPDPLDAVGRQFRFMGQRFIPDSRIMQQLTHPKVGGRNFPKGLDVFAAMGSERALDILIKDYKCDKFQGFGKQMSKMRTELKATPRATWQSNLYWGWLWALKSIANVFPSGYPSFMRSQAWLDKSLFTGLGSWTELRHDTILYAKQSVSECGGAEEDIPQPKGYVEPNLEFWTKMVWLNRLTIDGLTKRGLVNEQLKDKFAKFDDWLEFCRRITIKELTNRKVTHDEYTQIQIFGAELESLFLNLAEGDILSDTDKDMALVADVHTSFGNCLEEGTGRAAAIYVVVPIEGKLYLTRGAVYTQYEFMHPASDRLTDEQWQKMLKSRQDPGLALWTKSFFIKKNRKPAPEFENYFGGC